MQPRNRDFNLLIKKDFQFSNLGNLWEKGKRFSCKSLFEFQYYTDLFVINNLRKFAFSLSLTYLLKKIQRIKFCNTVKAIYSRRSLNNFVLISLFK